MKIKVHLLAFGREGEIREVDVPDDEVGTSENPEYLLECVFYCGQNDFQPQPHPSVSQGDVIELPSGVLYVVDSVGFSRLSPEQFEVYRNLPRRDRSLHEFYQS
jgi:hypothetical protein